MYKKIKGFTLIELILVIAIIAILAAAIFVAVDPARRLHETRNSRRSSDIINILDAVIKYQVDNDGSHYGEVSALNSGEYAIIGTSNSSFLCRDSHGTGFYSSAVDACAGSDGDGDDTAGDCVDLSAMGSNYLARVPMDPSSGTADNTQYYISEAANGTITVGACDEEGEDAGGGGTPPVIELSR